MYKEDFHAEILASHRVVMAEFSFNEVPFQVFTQDAKGEVFMFDFGSRGWECSGVGFPANVLYSESGQFPYWADGGFVVKNAQGSIRLKTLPREFATVEKIFK